MLEMAILGRASLQCSVVFLKGQVFIYKTFRILLILVVCRSVQCCGRTVVFFCLSGTFCNQLSRLTDHGDLCPVMNSMVSFQGNKCTSVIIR